MFKSKSERTFEHTTPPQVCVFSFYPYVAVCNSDTFVWNTDRCFSSQDNLSTHHELSASSDNLSENTKVSLYSVIPTAMFPSNYFYSTFHNLQTKVIIIKRTVCVPLMFGTSEYDGDQFFADLPFEYWWSGQDWWLYIDKFIVDAIFSVSFFVSNSNFSLSLFQEKGGIFTGMFKRPAEHKVPALVILYSTCTGICICSMYLYTLSEYTVLTALTFAEKWIHKQWALDQQWKSLRCQPKGECLSVCSACTLPS